MSDMHGFSQLGEILKKTLQAAGIAERLEKQSAITAWPEIVGQALAENAIPIKIDKDTLIVRAKSAAWRNELIFFKPQILAKIAERIGKDKIKDIVFY